MVLRGGIASGAGLSAGDWSTVKAMAFGLLVHMPQFSLITRSWNYLLELVVFGSISRCLLDGFGFQLLNVIVDIG